MANWDKAKGLEVATALTCTKIYKRRKVRKKERVRDDKEESHSVLQSTADQAPVR